MSLLPDGASEALSAVAALIFGEIAARLRNAAKRRRQAKMLRGAGLSHAEAQAYLLQGFTKDLEHLREERGRLQDDRDRAVAVQEATEDEMRRTSDENMELLGRIEALEISQKKCIEHSEKCDRRVEQLAGENKLMNERLRKLEEEPTPTDLSDSSMRRTRPMKMDDDDK